MKRKIKLLALVLTICLTFAACSSSSSDYDDTYYNGDDTEQIDQTSENKSESAEPLHKTEVPSGYIGIYTAEDLKNSGANSEGNYILMNDIDLSSIPDWEGIRNSGVFDGNNYSIRNLKSTTGGLFKNAKSVLDLNLENVNIHVVASDYIANGHGVNCAEYIGGLADYGEYVDNCTISGEIKLTLDTDYKDTSWSDYTPKYKVGGLVGSGDDDGSVTNCTNNAKVIAENKVKSYYIYVGGIIGRGYSTKVSHCKNYGQIYATSLTEMRSVIAGGICGEISYCYLDCNYGEVFSTGYAGGIVGHVNGALKVDSCFNGGKITGKMHTNIDDGLGLAKGSCVGGIVGYILSANGLITNSYNVGECNGANNCGGIVGGRYSDRDVDIKYCAYSTQEGLSITGSAAMFADNKAMSLEEMKDLSNYPFTNKDSVWKNGTGDYPYPVFK